MRQFDFFACTGHKNIHSGFEFTGADPHDSNPVPVSRIHICLDLEDEAGEIFVSRFNDLVRYCHMLTWARSKIHKGIKECLNAEASQS
ncbi:hypothetical protein SDC9_101625 [bioreactor metagenome]|uniref:Uncharacterized protein n=1 Tax=bioreactor metagenome TaxID=1076179 RepID=A0A645AVB6_9ZZZZ